MGLDEIRIEYFTEQLEKGVKAVLSAQAEAARSNIYADGNLNSEGRSGLLLEALESPAYTVATAGGGLQIVSRMPQYGRFIDMKAHGNRKIYDRIVWGILYRETLQDIKYEFRDWVEKNYGEALRELMKN